MFICNWLTNKLGQLGTVVSYFVMAIIAVMPLVAIDVNIWLTLLIALIVSVAPIPFLDAALWIWGLVVVILHNPTSTFAILYYIVFAIVIILPYTTGFIAATTDTRS